MKKNNVIMSISKNKTSIPIGAHLRHIKGTRQSGCNNLEEQSVLGCNQIVFEEKDENENISKKITHFTSDLNTPHYILITTDFGDTGAITLESESKSLNIDNIKKADFDYNDSKDITSVNKNKEWIINLSNTVKDLLIKNDVLFFNDVNIQIKQKDDLYYGKNTELTLFISTKYTLSIYNKTDNKVYYLVFIENKEEAES